MQRPGVRQDDGFTLVEVLVVISIAGAMAALAVFGWSGYARSQEHSGTRNDVVSALRAAHQRAVTEAVAYCVRFDSSAGTWTTYRLGATGVATTSGCGSSPQLVKGPEEVESKNISLAAVEFLQSNGTKSSDVVFTARGTASPGSLEIRRAGASKVFTVDVEGLTARVSAN